MLYFCTLYNSNYAAKGLAMYWSLRQVCSEFNLYVFAFDDILAAALKKMALPNMTVITLLEFEDVDLLRVKPTRSIAEYCWTCTSSTILYCLNHFNIEHCTYLDSDVFFYQNPQILIDEMGTADILITPHWFAPDRDNSDKVGKYCVQFVTARNNENGRKVIADWRKKCIEWCYSHYEDGKMGDQMYLDTWPEQYKGICVTQNMGAGIAPWNMQRYSFEYETGTLYAKEYNLQKRFPIVFVHFHFVFTIKKWFLYQFLYDTYPISRQCSEMIFCPYLRILIRAFKRMRNVDSEINGLAVSKAESVKDFFVRWIVNVKNSDYRHYYWI